MKSRLISLVLLLVYVSLTGVDAKEPGAVYVKNSGKEIMHLWVNGSYQGYLKPGETRYTVSDGFITDSSDRPIPSGGRTPVKESHGGWENDKSGSVKVTVQYPGGTKQSDTYSADDEGNVIFGANEADNKAPPEIPNELEVENAPAIRKGRMPNLKQPPVIDPPVEPKKLNTIAGIWQPAGWAVCFEFTDKSYQGSKVWKEVKVYRSPARDTDPWMSPRGVRYTMKNGKLILLSDYINGVGSFQGYKLVYKIEGDKMLGTCGPLPADESDQLVTEMKKDPNFMTPGMPDEILKRVGE